jgi:hypothetical protein
MTKDIVREQPSQNLVFQMEVLTNSDGERGISHIECDPPNESTDDQLRVVGIHLHRPCRLRRD